MIFLALTAAYALIAFIIWCAMVVSSFADAADQRLHDETDWLGVGGTELGARGIHSGEINDAAQ